MSFYTNFLQNNSKNDLYETPGKSIDLILERLDSNIHVIWEPFPGSGHSTRYMRGRGFIVTNGSDPDFFNQVVPNAEEVAGAENIANPQLVLVTNPHFSTKKEILEKVVVLGVQRVALLLPAATIYTKYFRKYITDTGEENFRYLVHSKRCNFLDPKTGEATLGKNGKKGSCSFDVAWFTSGLGDRFPYGVNFGMNEIQ